MRSSLTKTASYTLARVVSALVGVLSVPIYTHILKLEEYGAYAIAFATVSVFNALLFHWIAAATARIYPQHLGNIPRFVGLVMRFWVKSVVVLVGLSVLAWLILPSGRSGIVLASSVLLISTSMYEFSLELSRSALRAGAYAVAVVTYAVVGLAAGALLAYWGSGAVSPLFGVSIGQLAAVFALRQMGVIEMTNDANAEERRAVVKHMLMYGVPLSGALVLSMLLASADRYLIEHFLGLKQVAIYAATYSLVFPGVVLIASVVNLTGYPKIMRAFEAGDAVAVRTLMRQQVTVLLIVLMPILIGAFTLSRQISGALPHSTYSAGVSLLPYITLAAILNVLRSTYVDLALHITKKVMWLVTSLFVALLIGVAANVIALPRYGITAAAISLCVCYLSALAMSAAAAIRNHELPLPGRRELLAMSVGVILMWAALRTSPFNGGLFGLSMLVAFGGAAYFTGFGLTWVTWPKLIQAGSRK